MSAAPVIGLPTYPPNQSGRFHLPAAYVTAVRRAGGLPLLIPPGEPRLADVFEHLDGVLLTGGGDVDPELYGGEAHERIAEVDRGRDDSEIALVRATLETGKPTLAICRGTQLLNVALGGSLIEHLPDVVGDAIVHRPATKGELVFHPISIREGTRLASILGVLATEPSSDHHQAIRQVAAGLEVSARAPDGTIEGVELPEHPFLVGVQWHPEDTAADDPHQQRLFDALVAAARRAR
jgi:putative glutamine amidotransferase